MKGFEAGADDYCVKPFKSDEIIKKIDAILGEQKWMKIEKRLNTIEELLADKD